MADRNQAVQSLSTSMDVDPMMNFKVTKLHGVAAWSWNIDVESCAICRNHIMSPCIECQANLATQDNLKCGVAWGQCNHVSFYNLFIHFFVID